MSNHVIGHGEKDHAKSSVAPRADIDIGLWLKFKAGDAQALGKLAQIHYRELFNYASRFSSDSDFIRDSIQELYLDLWERRTFLSETAFVKSYLFKAIRHKLTKELIRIRRFQMPGPMPDAEVCNVSVETQIIEIEHRKQNIKQLKHTLSLLSKRQQEIIYLRFYQNLDNEDISRVMNLSRQCVANLLYRTLREIRLYWSQRLSH